eukprot:TRINITY_DN78822_c0_g1_i1.p1 TRINITY_DN78822_c0_g1~~TRINITY_DN78822_c0_g1_i1.p1  ORF type:complete len:919 (+),score=173.45 TRINITY_DN78822_c0_g1_i1:288-2759(+)
MGHDVKNPAGGNLEAAKELFQKFPAELLQDMPFMVSVIAGSRWPLEIFQAMPEALRGSSDFIRLLTELDLPLVTQAHDSHWGLQAFFYSILPPAAADAELMLKLTEKWKARDPRDLQLFHLKSLPASVLTDLEFMERCRTFESKLCGYPWESIAPLDKPEFVLECVRKKVAINQRFWPFVSDCLKSDIPFIKDLLEQISDYENASRAPHVIYELAPESARDDAAFTKEFGMRHAEQMRLWGPTLKLDKTMVIEMVSRKYEKCYFEDLPEALLDDEDVARAAAVIDRCDHHQYFSKRLRSLPELMTEWAKSISKSQTQKLLGEYVESLAVLEQFEKNGYKVPEAAYLRLAPDRADRAAEKLLTEYQSGTALCKWLSADKLDDEQFMLQVLKKQGPYFTSCASARLRNDPDFLKKVVDLCDGCGTICLQACSEAVRDDAEAVLYVFRNEVEKRKKSGAKAKATAACSERLLGDVSFLRAALEISKADAVWAFVSRAPQAAVDQLERKEYDVPVTDMESIRLPKQLAGDIDYYTEYLKSLPKNSYPNFGPTGAESNLDLLLDFSKINGKVMVYAAQPLKKHPSVTRCMIEHGAFNRLPSAMKEVVPVFEYAVEVNPENTDVLENCVRQGHHTSSKEILLSVLRNLTTRSWTNWNEKNGIRTGKFCKGIPQELLADMDVAKALVSAGGENLEFLPEGIRKDNEIQKLRLTAPPSESFERYGIQGTPELHRASFWRDLASVQRLLASKADPNEAHSTGAVKGLTPLQLAVMRKATDVEAALRSAGAEETAYVLVSAQQDYDHHTGQVIGIIEDRTTVDFSQLKNRSGP